MFSFCYNLPMSDQLVIAGHAFNSRLIVGTGKYRSFQEMARAHAASGADMVTVAAKAADQGIKFASNAELAAHPWVHALIDSEVRRLTIHLAQYETIKRFALLPEDFTFDNGSLTFTLKLKRRVVEQQYAAVIESLYADVAEPRPILQD